MLSFWERNTFFSDIDYLVIGAGIVGLNAALHLRTLSPKSKIIVLERGFLPNGASTKNAGFACFGSLTELSADLKNGHSLTELMDLVDLRWRGLLRLREKLGDENIGYEQKSGYEIFTKEDRASFVEASDKMEFFNTEIGKIISQKKIYQLANGILHSFRFNSVTDMIENTAEGQLDTGKMMQTLAGMAVAKGISIFYGVNVQSFENENNGVRVVLQENIEIKAKKLLICTNGLTRRLLPKLDVIPARNQVLITKPISKLLFQGCFHYQEGYYYFRNVGNRVLLGGGRHLDKEKEATDEMAITPLIQKKLDNLLKNIILHKQSYEIEHVWAGILGIGSQKKPIIQMVAPHIGAAVRMGGMGVAIGTIIGEQGAEMITEKL